MDPRALVAAVLGPHHREDAELGQRRLAAERADDALVFVRREAVAVAAPAASIGTHDDSGHRSAPVAAQRVDDRFEQHEAVGAAERRFARALRVRHQPDDVAALAADAGDAVERAVRIRRVGDLPAGVAVAEDDRPDRLEPSSTSGSAK